MGYLYSRSQRTVIWLGMPTGVLPQGMDFFLKLSRSVAENGAVDRRHLSTPDDWRALKALLKLPWWRRVWTLQELVLSREVCFFCGPEKSFTGRDFRRALQAIDACSHGAGTGVDDEGAWLPAWSRGRVMAWRQTRSGRDGLSLVALMAYTSDFGVSFAQDLMYGMLGLASKEDKDMLEDSRLMGYSEKSKSRSIELLYSNFVEAFIRERGSLDIICFAELFRSGYATKSEHRGVERGRYPTTSNTGRRLLPTWVPDWRVYRASFVIPLMVSQSSSKHIGNFRPVKKGESAEIHHYAKYAACGDKELQFDISDDYRWLRVVGFVLDHIDGLGEAVGVHPHDSQDHKLLALVQSTGRVNTTPEGEGPSSPANNLELFRKVVRTIVLGHKDRYLSKALTRTSDCRHRLTSMTTMALDPGKYEELQESKSARFVYKWAFRWLRANESLLIRGIRLGDLLLGEENHAKTTTKANTGEEVVHHHHNVPGAGSSGSHAALDLSDEKGHVIPCRLCDTAEPWKMGKRLFTTETVGLVGMGPARARKGDLVCVLVGCSVPVVLRRKQGLSEEEKDEAFEFVGECYVDGYMNGEVLKTGRKESEFFLV